MCAFTFNGSLQYQKSKSFLKEGLHMFLNRCWRDVSCLATARRALAVQAPVPQLGIAEDLLDPAKGKLHPRKPAHGMTVQQRLFHQRGTQVVRDLKHVQPQHDGQRAGLAALSPLMVEGPDPGCQRGPGHGLGQLVENQLTAGQLAGLAMFPVCKGGLL